MASPRPGARGMCCERVREAMGVVEGFTLGAAVGALEGTTLGDAVGVLEGTTLGDAVGVLEGTTLGDAVGVLPGCTPLELRREDWKREGMNQVVIC
eukprot:scaffold288_cov44-Cyclotella_meneghiniana.AAC.1